LALKNSPDRVAASGGNLEPERPTRFSGERNAPELPYIMPRGLMMMRWENIKFKREKLTKAVGSPDAKVDTAKPENILILNPVIKN
jgi:hypothetical protein